MSIIVRKGKVITRAELCKAKEKCHKNQAKLSFEEKICILVELQKTSKSARFHKKRLSEKSNQPVASNRNLYKGIIVMPF